MEKQLKCFLLLSLKEMALRRVAVLFWSDPDILASLSKCGLSIFHANEWRNAIEDKIKDKMLKLIIPDSLTKQMIDIVRYICIEVISWKENQLYILRVLQKPVSVKLCWTTAGTISYRRTAEELVRCDKFDVKQRYELACHYCLEDDISLYWEELPQEEKGKYSDFKCVLEFLPVCFSYILKGERTKLDDLAIKLNRNLTSFNQFAFEDSAKKCRKTAAEYFFQQLTPNEKEVSLMRTARAVMADTQIILYFPNEKRSDLLCYLLSVMTSEQQMETIKSCPDEVFLCFLHWPLLDLFLDNAGLLWTLLPPSNYTALINKMIHRYEKLDICFPKMLKKFFTESPRDFKEWFVGDDSELGFTPAYNFLSTFFDFEDSESIEGMFRSLDAADRVKLVFQRSVLELFYRMHIFHRMRSNRWHLVEVCLRETPLSKEEKGRLKEAFTGYFGREVLFSHRFKRFFDFLDKTDASSDKREKGQKRKLENCSSE